ncbi:MAG TPA: tyrosine-type recombinase/integrase [Ktedonobacteraceae bacterium]|nr:tyrosine-type recombinase/integrase [Ktedonobacteraceae bacterium]
MISSTVVDSGDWPEEIRMRNRARRCRSTQRAEQPDPRQKVREPVEHLIETWLHENYPPTYGESTAAIYGKVLFSFRAYLRERGLDLDSPKEQLTQAIQDWAGSRVQGSKHQGNVSPATYNQRIAAIDSFYTWVSKRDGSTWSNPARSLGRNKIQKYGAAAALDVQQVRNRLKEIDRSTPRGQRDYVLLQVALNTGRSARELASLSWGNIKRHGDTLSLTFAGGRGGKVMQDTLDNRLSQMLLDYLHMVYGENLNALGPQAPIWVSYSDRTYGQAIGQQTIADISETHLGISRTQQLRHTFALTMDKLGAPVDIIQDRLGHENKTTTNVYLANLKRASNPYAGVLADTFGLERA